MPQLPDLKAKVKVDLSELDMAAAKAAILGQALKKELGGTSGAEVDRSMKQIGTSVEDMGRKIENAGTAFIKWGDSGNIASLRISSSTARTKGDFDELERRTRSLGASLENEFKKGTSAVVKLGEDGSAALGNVSRSMVDTQKNSQNLFQQIGGIATAIGGALIPVLIGTAVALAPMAALLLSFAAGLTAVLAVVTLAGAGFLALGAGITILAAATQGWMAKTLPVAQAQQNVANATLAHQAAVLKLQQAQQANSGTSSATAAQTLGVAQAQAGVSNATLAHQAAVLKLNQAQTAYSASATHTAAQTLALQQAQQGVSNATLGQQAATLKLTQAHQAAAAHGPTPASQLALAQAQQGVTNSTNALTKAQNDLTAAQTGASNPLETLKTDLEAMANTLGEKAVPMATLLLGWLDKLIPKVQEMGVGLLTWFGPRLAPFLEVATSAFNNLMEVVSNLAGVFGRFMDQALARAPTFGPIVRGALDFVVAAADGLLQNLLRLGDWFAVRLPTYGPIVSSIMSAIGSATMGLLQSVGWLADRFVDFWIASGKVVEVSIRIGQTAWPALSESGRALGEIMSTLLIGIKPLGDAFQLGATKSDQLTHSTNDTRDAFTRFMTSPFVIQTEALLAVELPAAIKVTVDWLKILADGVALAMVAIATNIKVTADIMRGDLPKAAQDAQAGLAAAQEIMKRDATNTSDAIKATNEEMDGTVERRTEEYKLRMLHLFDETKSGAIDKHRQMKEESLQQLRELQDQAVGHSIIPDMVTIGLRWFTQLQTGASSQMFQLSVNAQAHANSLGIGVRDNISRGLGAALDVIRNFVKAINSALGGFGVNIPLAQIGATPGVGPPGLRPLAMGGVTTGPALIGEGHGREWVIPEDPNYRGNALTLLKQAALALGVYGLAGGGILNWLPNAGAMVQGPGGGFSHSHLNAWDYPVPMFSPLFAGLPGTSSQFTSGYGGGYGNSILFNMDQGGQLILAHLAAVLARGHVNAGALIGLTDNTGASTGPHLHFEVRGSALNPMTGGYAGGLPGLAGMVAPIDIGALLRAALSPLTGAAHAAASALNPAWVRSIANSLIDKVAINVGNSIPKPPGFAGGGLALPGSLFTAGERGPELGYALPGGGVAITPGDPMDETERLLRQAVNLLANIAGRPPLTPLAAVQRLG